MSGIFTHATDDGFVRDNPTKRLNRFLTSKDTNLGKFISPYSADELESYLSTCERYFPKYYPFFLTLARTGMRLGEALGLQWGDLDFRGNFIELRRAIVYGSVTAPKNGLSRRVHITPQLVEALKQLRTKHKEETLSYGWGEVPDWIFVNQTGKKPIDGNNLRRRIHNKICEKAGLRQIRIHDIRHSYATIRIQKGHNIADVSKQLGHKSLSITINIYYHWIPDKNGHEADELDDLESQREKNIN